MYGLKQAAKCWNESINRVLLNCGFERLKSELRVNLKRENGQMMIIALYVDDLLCISTSDERLEVEAKLKSQIKFKT